MAYQSFSEYRRSEEFKKVREKDNIKKKQREPDNINYSDTGGLPANLRYPYAMIDSGMDFLKIQIATYTPPDVELEGRPPVSL